VGSVFQKYSINGSYSLEAALLFGIIFLILEGMIIVMFSFHDRVIIREKATRILLENSSSSTQEKENMFSEECNQRCLITQVQEVVIQEENRQLVISYREKTNYVFQNIMIRYFKKKEKKTESICIPKEIDAPQFLRIIHGIFQ